MEELYQKWAVRDGLYAASLRPLTETQAFTVRQWRRQEAGEVEAAARKAAYMKASRWTPPVPTLW